MAGPLSIDQWPDFTLKCSGEHGITTFERALEGHRLLAPIEEEDLSTANGGLVL